MVAWCSLSVRFSIFSYVEWSFVGFLSSGICLFVSFAQALSFDRPPTQVQIPALQNLRRNRGRIIKRGGGTFEKQAPREGGHPLPLLIAWPLLLDRQQAGTSNLALGSGLSFQGLGAQCQRVGQSSIHHF